MKRNLTLQLDIYIGQDIGSQMQVWLAKKSQKLSNTQGLAN